MWDLGVNEIEGGDQKVQVSKRTKAGIILNNKMHQNSPRETGGGSV